MTDTQMTEEQMVEELEAEQSMFVQTARAVTSDGTTLTLKDVTPSTLYFSDRPKRIVGHMTTVDFVDLWAEGDNNFEEDPPNAVLSFLESAAIKHPKTLSSSSSSRILRTASSPTPSRPSRAPFPRRRVPSHCSSTRSDGRFRPYPSAG